MNFKKISVFFFVVLLKLNSFAALTDLKASPCFGYVYYANFYKYLDNGKYLLFTVGDVNSISRSLYLWKVESNSAAYKISDSISMSIGVQLANHGKSFIYGEIDRIDDSNCILQASLLSHSLSKEDEPLLISKNVNNEPIFITHDGENVIYNMQIKRDPGSRYLFSRKVDASSSSVQLSNSPFVTALGVSPVDNKVIYSDFENIYVRDSFAKTEPLYLGTADYTHDLHERFFISSNGKKVIYVDGDDVVLNSLDVAGEAIKLSNSPSKSFALAMLKNRNEVLLSQYSAGNTSRIYAKNLDTLAERELGYVEGSVRHLEAIDKDEHFAILVAEYNSSLSRSMSSIDLENNRSPIYFDNSFSNTSIFQISNDQKYIIYGDTNDSYLSTYLSPFDGGFEPIQIGRSVFMPDNNSLIYKEAPDRETSELFIKNFRDQKEPTFLAKYNHSITPLSVTPDGKFLIFVLSNFYYEDYGSGKVLFAKSIEDDEAPFALTLVN